MLAYGVVEVILRYEPADFKLVYIKANIV